MSETLTIIGEVRNTDVGTIQVAEANGFKYFITSCCHASAKGSGEAVVCRNCYQEVSWVFGDSVDGYKIVPLC